MKKAGFKSGKCEGSECEITMVGDNEPPGRDTAEVFQDQLEDLGFKVSFQPVDHALMYTQFCRVPAQQPDVCPNVGWIKDFRDSQCCLTSRCTAPVDQPSNNTNWPMLDVPEINKAIEEARLISDPEERGKAWASSTRWSARRPRPSHGCGTTTSIIQSEDVAGVVNLFNALVRPRFTSLK